MAELQYVDPSTGGSNVKQSINELKKLGASKINNIVNRSQQAQQPDEYDIKIQGAKTALKGGYDAGVASRRGVSGYDFNYYNPEDEYLKKAASLAKSGNALGTTVSAEGVDEARAREQGAISKLVNGTIKGVGNFATTFLSGTVGLALGIVKAVADGFDPNVSATEAFSRLWDNEVTQGLHEFNTKMEEWLPNYYSREELEADLFSWSNLASANFWGDKFIKNLGFTAGSIAAGGLYTKGINLLAAGLKASRIARGAINIGKTDKMIKALNGEIKAAEKSLAVAKRTGDAKSIISAEKSLKGLQSQKTSLEGIRKTQETLKTAIDAKREALSFKEAVKLAEEQMKFRRGWAEANRFITASMGAFGEGSIEAVMNTHDWMRYQKQNLDMRHAERMDEVLEKYMNEGRIVQNPITGEFEGDLEAYNNEIKELEAKRDKEEDFLESEKARMGNAIVAGNMAVVSLSNYLTTAKYLTRGFKTANKASKLKYIANKAAKKDLTKAERKALINKAKKDAGSLTADEAKYINVRNKFGNKKWTAAKYGYTIGKPMATEAWEEQTQGVVADNAGMLSNDIVGAYLDNSYNYDDINKASHYMGEFWKMLSPHYAMEETLISLTGNDKYRGSLTKVMSAVTPWEFGHQNAYSVKWGDKAWWEEGLIGALTGIVGVPMGGKSNTQNAWLGRGKKFGIVGGVVEDVRKLNQKRKQDKANAEKMTTIFQGDFGARAKHLIKQMAYNRQQAEFARNGQEVEYNTSDTQSTVEDLLFMERMGMLDSYMAELKRQGATSEDIQRTIEESKQTYATALPEAQSKTHQQAIADTEASIQSTKNSRMEANTKQEKVQELETLNSQEEATNKKIAELEQKIAERKKAKHGLFNKNRSKDKAAINALERELKTAQIQKKAIEQNKQSIQEILEADNQAEQNEANLTSRLAELNNMSAQDYFEEMQRQHEVLKKKKDRLEVELGNAASIASRVGLGQSAQYQQILDEFNEAQRQLDENESALQGFMPETISPYMNEDGTMKSEEEVGKMIEERNADIEGFISQIQEAKKHLKQQGLGGIFNEEQLDTLTWYQVMGEYMGNKTVEAVQPLLDKIDKIKQSSSSDTQGMIQDIMEQYFMEQIMDKDKSITQVAALEMARKQADAAFGGSVREWLSSIQEVMNDPTISNNDKTTSLLAYINKKVKDANGKEMTMAELISESVDLISGLVQDETAANELKKLRDDFVKTLEYFKQFQAKKDEFIANNDKLNQEKQKKQNALQRTAKKAQQVASNVTNTVRQNIMGKRIGELAVEYENKLSELNDEIYRETNPQKKQKLENVKKFIETLKAVREGFHEFFGEDVVEKEIDAYINFIAKEINNLATGDSGFIGLLKKTISTKKEAGILDDGEIKLALSIVEVLTHAAKGKNSMTYKKADGTEVTITKQGGMIFSQADLKQFIEDLIEKLDKVEEEVKRAGTTATAQTPSNASTQQQASAPSTASTTTNTSTTNSQASQGTQTKQGGQSTTTTTTTQQGAPNAVNTQVTQILEKLVAREIVTSETNGVIQDILTRVTGNTESEFINSLFEEAHKTVPLDNEVFQAISSIASIMNLNQTYLDGIVDSFHNTVGDDLKEVLLNCGISDTQVEAIVENIRAMIQKGVSIDHIHNYIKNVSQNNEARDKALQAVDELKKVLPGSNLDKMKIRLLTVFNNLELKSNSEAAQLVDDIIEKLESSQSEAEFFDWLIAEGVLNKKMAMEGNMSKHNKYFMGIFESTIAKAISEYKTGGTTSVTNNTPAGNTNAGKQFTAQEKNKITTRYNKIKANAAKAKSLQELEQIQNELDALNEEVANSNYAGINNQNAAKNAITQRKEALERLQEASRKSTIEDAIELFNKSLEAKTLKEFDSLAEQIIEQLKKHEEKFGETLMSNNNNSLISEYEKALKQNRDILESKLESERKAKEESEKNANPQEGNKEAERANPTNEETHMGIPVSRINPPEAKVTNEGNQIADNMKEEESGGNIAEEIPSAEELKVKPGYGTGYNTMSNAESFERLSGLNNMFRGMISQIPINRNARANYDTVLEYYESHISETGLNKEDQQAFLAYLKACEELAKELNIYQNVSTITGHGYKVGDKITFERVEKTVEYDGKQHTATVTLIKNEHGEAIGFAPSRFDGALATIRANKARDIANMVTDMQRKAQKNQEANKLLAAAKVYNAFTNLTVDQLNAMQTLIDRVIPGDVNKVDEMNTLSEIFENSDDKPELMVYKEDENYPGVNFRDPETIKQGTVFLLVKDNTGKKVPIKVASTRIASALHVPAFKAALHEQLGKIYDALLEAEKQLAEGNEARLDTKLIDTLRNFVRTDIGIYMNKIQKTGQTAIVFKDSHGTTLGILHARKDQSVDQLSKDTKDLFIRKFEDIIKTLYKDKTSNINLEAFNTNEAYRKAIMEVIKTNIAPVLESSNYQMHTVNDGFTYDLISAIESLRESGVALNEESAIKTVEITEKINIDDANATNAVDRMMEGLNPLIDDTQTTTTTESQDYDAFDLLNNELGFAESQTTIEQKEKTVDEIIAERRERERKVDTEVTNAVNKAVKEVIPEMTKGYMLTNAIQRHLALTSLSPELTALNYNIYRKKYEGIDITYEQFNEIAEKALSKINGTFTNEELAEFRKQAIKSVKDFGAIAMTYFDRIKNAVEKLNLQEKYPNLNSEVIERLSKENPEVLEEIENCR